MAKRNPNAWKKWYDPNATEADYERWREKHRAQVQDAALAMMDQVLSGSMETPELAARSGLSPGTVSRYRNGRSGPRGPLLTTWLALRHRG